MTTQFPGDPTQDEGVEEIRDQLIGLAARNKIKSTERFLKKATAKQLERIKAEYDRQETEVVDEMVSKYVIGALSTLMKSLEYVDEEECEEMRETLLNNDLVKRDLGNLSSYITRNIKYVGLATMVVVAGGYILAKRYGQHEVVVREPERSGEEEDQQEDQ